MVRPSPGSEGLHRGFHWSKISAAARPPFWPTSAHRRRQREVEGHDALERRTRLPLLEQGSPGAGSVQPLRRGCGGYRLFLRLTIARRAGGRCRGCSYASGAATVCETGSSTFVLSHWHALRYVYGRQTLSRSRDLSGTRQSGHLRRRLIDEACSRGACRAVPPKRLTGPGVVALGPSGAPFQCSNLQSGHPAGGIARSAAPLLHRFDVEIDFQELPANAFIDEPEFERDPRRLCRVVTLD